MNGIGHTRYYPQNVAIKYYNVMIDEQKFFNPSIKNDLRAYCNSQKITTGQVDDYTIGCLIDHHYSKKHKMMAIDLSKQQAVDADPKAKKKQIDFSRHLDDDENTTIFFITEEAK